MSFKRRSSDSDWSVTLLAILIALVAFAVIAVLVVVGGGRRTVASRSAAAFEEARRKGIPVTAGEHGHGALSPGAPAEGEHAGHGKAPMPTHDEHGMTQPDARGAAPHAGMQHGTPAPMPGTSRPTTEGTAGHAGHGAMPQAPAGVTGGVSPPPPFANAAVARPGQPAATLEPDPLDAPAATSQMDAKRSADLAGEMGSGGHGMQHGATPYRQLDAGRDTTKPQPAPTPVPTPGGHVHPGGGGR